MVMSTKHDKNKPAVMDDSIESLHANENSGPSEIASTETTETVVIDQEILDESISVQHASEPDSSHVQLISLNFTNLGKDSGASVILSSRDTAIWCLGSNLENFVGIKFLPGKYGLLMTNNLSLSDKICYFTVPRENASLRINLFVKVKRSQNLLRGRVEMPPGASVIIESTFDRSSLQDLSSFAVSLQPY